MVTPIDDLLRAVAGRLLDHPKSRAQVLWRQWPHLFGPQLARHAEPVHIHQGILTVRVDTAAWMTELAFLKPDMLDKLQPLLPPGSLRDIRFQQGTLSSQTVVTAPAPRPVIPAASAAERRRIETECATIKDEQLRRSVYRFLLRVHVAHRVPAPGS